MSITKATYSMIQGAVFNVLDYGADSTGVTDSTSAINAAITAAGNNNEVFFPAGTYLTTGINLSAKTAVTLRGQGEGSIITGGGTATYGVRHGERTKVRDLTITQCVSGIYHANGSGTETLTDNVNITNVTNGVFNEGAWNCTYRNVRVRNVASGGFGVKCQKSGAGEAYNTLIEDCTLGATASGQLANSTGIYFDYGGVIISGCDIEHWATALNITSVNVGSVVRDNHFEADSYILADSSEVFDFTGNTLALVSGFNQGSGSTSTYVRRFASNSVAVPNTVNPFRSCFFDQWIANETYSDSNRKFPIINRFQGQTNGGVVAYNKNYDLRQAASTSPIFYFAFNSPTTLAQASNANFNRNSNVLEITSQASGDVSGINVEIEGGKWIAEPIFIRFLVESASSNVYLGVQLKDSGGTIVGGWNFSATAAELHSGCNELIVPIESGVSESIATINIYVGSNSSGVIEVSNLTITDIFEAGYCYETVELSASAAPTVGVWSQSERVWNSAPASGGTPGWICTTSGTPGTWKAMANLA